MQNNKVQLSSAAFQTGGKTSGTKAQGSWLGARENVVVIIVRRQITKIEACGSPYSAPKYENMRICIYGHNNSNM